MFSQRADHGRGRGATVLALAILLVLATGKALAQAPAPLPVGTPVMSRGQAGDAVAAAAPLTGATGQYETIKPQAGPCSTPADIAALQGLLDQWIASYRATAGSLDAFTEAQKAVEARQADVDRTRQQIADAATRNVAASTTAQGAAAAATAQQLQQALPRQAADLQTQAAKRDQAYADFLPRLMDLRWAKAVFLAAQDDELKKPCPPPAAAMPQAGVGAGVAPAPAAPPPQPPGTARLSHSEMEQMRAGLPPIVRLQRLRLVPRNESSCFTPADEAELALLEEQEAQLSEEYAHDAEEMSGYEALHNTAKVLFGPKDPLTTESQEDINEIKEDLATIHSEWLDAEERAEELRSKPPCPPKVLYFVGGGFGAASRTATYDDGFKVRGVTGLFDVNAGARVPIADGLFLGARLGVMAPFAGSSREFATTKLNWAVMPEVELSLNLPSFKTFSDALLADYVKHGISQPKRPLQPLPVAFVTLGPAIGGLSSGSSYPGFAYSNTQTSVGITTSVGLEVPLSGNISVYGQFRYMGFPMTTFQSPYGSFKRDESVYAGTIGIKFNITNWTTNVIP